MFTDIASNRPAILFRVCLRRSQGSLNRFKCLGVPSAFLARSLCCNCKEVAFSEAGPGGGVGAKDQ